MTVGTAPGLTVSSALIVRKAETADGAFVDAVAADLDKRGIDVTVLRSDSPAVPWTQPPDVALSLGGDGTLLSCARIVAGHRIPILPINLGTFGFITDIAKLEWRDAFDSYCAGRLAISTRTMVEAIVDRFGKEAMRQPGLNDAVISTGGTPKIARLSVTLSGTPVGRYRADGVILSTPTGSTAYSMAAGGPILHPEMQAFVLNPVCPFTLSNRPLVVPGDEVVEIRVEEEQRTDVVLTVDGQESIPLVPGDRIILKKYEHSALLVQTDKRNFYEVLRHKLNWAGEPNA